MSFKKTKQAYAEKQRVSSCTACFPEDERFTESELREFFENSNNCVALLWDCNEMIGFSIARPVSEILPERVDELDTYNITTTEIHPEYQGRGYVGLLMHMLENELKNRGVRYIERNAKVGNGYGEKVAKQYVGRIVQAGEPRKTKFGIQQFF